MNKEGRTDFDLSITIPNTKSRSNMKYSANYVRLSEYMNLDDRLENALKNQTKIIEDHNEIIIQIRGSIRQAIDTSRFIFALNKLEKETEKKWGLGISLYILNMHSIDKLFHIKKNHFKFIATKLQ